MKPLFPAIPVKTRRRWCLSIDFQLTNKKINSWKHYDNQIHTIVASSTTSPTPHPICYINVSLLYSDIIFSFCENTKVHLFSVIWLTHQLSFLFVIEDGGKLSPIAVAFTDEQTKSFTKLSVSSTKTQMVCRCLLWSYSKYNLLYEQTMELMIRWIS